MENSKAVELASGFAAGAAMGMAGFIFFHVSVHLHFVYGHHVEHALLTWLSYPFSYTVFIIHLSIGKRWPVDETLLRLHAHGHGQS